MTNWNNLHARLMAEAFRKALGRPDLGTIAFARCLTPDVVELLATDSAFDLPHWKVWRVADIDRPGARTISADRAVEIREDKGNPVLLLVDTGSAGAGMDGIYSAAQEVFESELFKHALSLAAAEITKTINRETRQQTERAIAKALESGQRHSISPWTRFDYLVRVAAEQRYPGELLYLLGLWPASRQTDTDWDSVLRFSRVFVERLLGTTVAGLTPAQRIESLKLSRPSSSQLAALEQFLRAAAVQPLFTALTGLTDRPNLWIGALQVEESSHTIQSIEWVPWHTRSGKVNAWSGLIDGSDPEGLPELILSPDADKTGAYAKLEVRWRVRPDNLAKASVEYHVAIVTDQDEEIASLVVPHQEKKEQKCRFTDDDFGMLGEDALIDAKVAISVLDNQNVDPQETGEFTIRYGVPPERGTQGVGRKVRALSEGLIELDKRPDITALVNGMDQLAVDSTGYMLLRTPEKSKSYRVFRPPLIRDVEQSWAAQGGAIGRWQLRVHASGARAGHPDFVLFSADVLVDPSRHNVWDRVANASRRLAERFAGSSGVGQIYDEKSKLFDNLIRDYLNAWALLLEVGDPLLALANTVEIQSLSGRTLGLIVLPSHPMRVAWHAAYDNLVLYAAYEQDAKAQDVRREFEALDGAMFPAILPGANGGEPFVFADMLGFHVVGMVPHNDTEPKAAVAILARVLSGSEPKDAVPTVGRQSATVLGNEIAKYVDSHDMPRLLHIHALRSGDGMTIARALGQVQERYHRDSNDEQAGSTENDRRSPAFVLELYPSERQRGVAGRFIAESRDKRRSGAGVLAAEDRWMLESLSLPGGMNLPKLRWARKETSIPQSPAHIAVAFDTFESRVALNESLHGGRPLFVYGLHTFFDRQYTSEPAPLWRSSLLPADSGERHPSDRTHTDRLLKLQLALGRCVTRSLGAEEQQLVLRTEISPEKADSLRELHRLCDWVITLDRNGGIEYFDSPRHHPDVYDAYVIDCVPEREDLGTLQLITSTSNLEEVRYLLDDALDQMGLSHSRRNAEFLLENLKALSGRLAIRLTGQNAPTQELIALALSHASCRHEQGSGGCWTPLENGFLVPVDDVLDLIPPLMAIGESATNARPDLIYVSLVPRKGLAFQFVEVKYRRHLRSARSLDLLDGIHQQTQALRTRWDAWYGIDDPTRAVFLSIRRAKLARVLRFYADKAHRHSLAAENYTALVAEIDRMVERGSTYTFAGYDRPDRGWIFCPEYKGATPQEISAAGGETCIFIFGPGVLPDVIFDSESPPTDVALNGSRQGPTVTRSVNGGVTTTTDADQASDTQSGEQTADEGKVVDGDPAITLGEDLLTGELVRWQLTIKGNPHLLVAGLPGMGKTTLLLNLCRQWLAAGVRPIVFSYHQDFDERLESAGIPVRYVDFEGLGFNPLYVRDRTLRLAYLDVAGALRDVFMAIFPELGDLQGGSIRDAIKHSFQELGWDDPNADLSMLQEPAFSRFVEILRAIPRPDRGLKTLLVRLSELEDYGFFAPGNSQESLWESDRLIVIRIHSTTNDNLQKAFPSLVFYGLYKDMFRRGVQSRITHAVVFDEAHRAARLRLIPTMAKECRKYGISLVLASQEAKDFNVSLFSAIANYLVLRLNDVDAKALVRNVASSDQERMLVDRIKQMERFRALYFLEGRKKPYPVVLLP